MTFLGNREFFTNISSVFLNSKNKSFFGVSKKGKPSKNLLFTMNIGLRQDFLNKLNQLFRPNSRLLSGN